MNYVLRIDGKRLRPRMLGCILLFAFLGWGLLCALSKPLQLLFSHTKEFDKVYISSSQIPKIIHQTYANRSIPEHWRHAQETCLDLHQDYDYKFWTDEDADEFISIEYPWFMPTWKSYPHAIQRADAIRYFALVHFGGIYIDLDDGCNYRLDPLLQYPAWLPQTAPIGVSNDVMGSVPHHPFFERVIHALPAYNKNWASPYLTVMYSTGPLFLSEMREEYLTRDERPQSEKLFTLLPKNYDKDGKSIFRSYRGSSWHREDAKVIFWMGDHWIALVLLGTVAAIAMLGSLWKCYWCMIDIWRVSTYGENF